MDHPETEPAGVEAEVQDATVADQSEANQAEQFYSDDQPQDDQPANDDDPLDDDDDSEPAEEPTIAPPIGLKAEEQARFAHLSPEDQRFFADFAQRRHIETKNGIEAATLKQREAERTADDRIASTQQAHAQQLSQLVQAFAPQPPPIELAEQNLTAYIVQERQYKEAMAEYQALVQSIGGIGEQSTQHFQAREREAAEQRVKGLMSIPEFANSETRAQFIGDLEKFGTTRLGYSVEQLAQMDVTDMTALKRAMEDHRDAERWRAHQKKRNERPRGVQGRFSTAPAGNGAAAPTSGQTDVLKALYPND